jgi:MerR family copper efflux transcriptional regulator
MSGSTGSASRADRAVVISAAMPKALTIHQAATTTGWSPRMLRYVEQLGLVAPPRSPAGYRLYGPAQVERLRTLRALLDQHELELGDVAVALRLRREPDLAAALDDWFATAPAERVAVPPDVPDGDWLAFEQDKHLHLLSPRSEPA